MPQHDLDIANGSGAAVRADINGALAALGSCMKGPSAPTAPFAGMLWLEDDNPTSTRWTLRIYDGADWIVVGIVDAAANVFEPATTAIGLALIRAADAAAARVTLGAAAASEFVGQVAYFAANVPPTGWLRANGAAVSRVTYAALWNHAQASGNLAATEGGKAAGQFGPGDGLTTFSLPDLRGEFLRGWDDARGVDSGRAIGTSQAGLLGSHTHTGTTSTNGAHSHTTDIAATNNPRSESQSYYGPGPAFGAFSWPSSTAGSHSHTFTTEAAGGAETRPRNVALLACIKF